jgi:hypothetical protein
MNPPNSIFRIALFSALSFAAVALAAPPVPPRVQGPVDDAMRVSLHGNAHPPTQAGLDPGQDQGAVEDSQPAGRMLLLLQRSPAQETALNDFLQAAHTPGNPGFHQWLTPEAFGRLYGPADSDLAAVTAWLESHGLAIQKVHAGRLAIEFSGTAGQVSEAFQTKLHRYLDHGEARMASPTDPSVPTALAPVLAGLAPVGGYHPQSQLKVLGQAQFNARTHQATPQWTYPEGGGVVFVMAPGDFATQYDINSVYKSGITGAGESIAIISTSNVDLSLVQAYQTLFGLSPNLPVVVVDGEDPGENGDATEAYLDVEIAGSVAPGAKVLLYTSAGTALTDGLAMAAYRAVEDDQAAVISVSYGECETQLGQSGNAFWNALWQQAAAQGQTVFVSAGDGGSAGCDDFNAQQVAYGGLQVNGIASTPYNVAVGGTDFYYSQYAGSSASINSQLGFYWSESTTTAPAVSLLQTIPEQPWNDFFGLNAYDGGNPANQPSQTIVAGGGGASSAALYANGSTQGYPKPAWQTGAGVPADQVRDLPDVSLFAANGYNYSFYPICANPGDCSSANLNGSGVEVITGVGGTSVSSPAMAAIQALIDQSAGSWQGQADFIYYPLAARQSTVFHDVTVGGNQVLCYPSTANCATGSAASNSTGFSVESGYSAGAGYDLATGLGSVDVANLIKYWNTVAFTPTTTTLSVSPSSFVHGKTATVSGSVSRCSGSGTPSGSVSLTGNDGITHYAAIDDPALIAGSFYAQVDNLPGGTYQLTAVYGGDGTFAASKSQLVTITITPENDTLAATGWAWNPFDLDLYALSSGMTLPYGAQIYLDAQPVSGNATIASEPTPATGTVTFTDKLGAATTASTQPLNASGVAEWSTGVFAPGSHTVTESYSGDPSYNPSNTTTSFTVIPGSTSLTVKPLASSVAAGASVAVDVQMTTGYLALYGTPPTGNVTVTLGGTSASAAWQAFGPTGNANLEAVVTFNNVPAGLLPLSATYAGDSNWMGSSASGGTVNALSCKLTPTVALTASSVNPAPGQTLTLTASVAGPQGMPTPTGTIAFLSDGQSFDAIVTLNKGTAALAIPAYFAANGTNIFTAVYQGDANYNSAASNAVNVAVAQSDFSLTTQNAELQISPSGSGTSTLALAPVNGFNATVTIASSAPAGITVTPATASPAVSVPTTDALTIKVAASMAAGIYPLTITATGGGHVHSAQVLVRVLVVAAPVFAPPSGTYTTAQSVTLTDATPGATIYYTTNGTTPTASSAKYTAAIPVSGAAALTETIQAIAVVSGYAPSSVASAVYVITPPAAAPTFTPAAGTYTAVQSVTLADATPGATLYYTTNGTTPTAGSTPYTGAIAVAATQTIKAVAFAPGYTQSPVASAAYTINLPSFGCPAGSGSCFEDFAGSSGTSLSTHNSKWVRVAGSGTITTSGNSSAEIASTGIAEYSYSASTSETSQITIAPSSTIINYEKLACVRASALAPGYCLGFSSVSSGIYSNCYVMKNFSYFATGGCGTVLAKASHTLRLVASGASPVTLSIYVDGVLKGTVTDSSATPYTVAGSGFGLEGDGTATDSDVTEWQDYGAAPVVNGCPAGSGSCLDNFIGASGTSLSVYNSKWVRVAGVGTITTSGVNSAEIASTGIAEYSYSASTSETSQIVVAPSSTTINYEKLACVRASAIAPGYCVGFSSVSSGNYSNCYVMKNFGYLGTGGCGTVSAKVSHTLRLVASGSSPVTLSIYVDGVLKGTVKDSSATPYTVAGSGFGLEGDGTPADSDVTGWQDYGAAPVVNGCPAGSGSCLDNFIGASGTSLSTYNSKWVRVAGSGTITTSGSNSAEIASTGIAEYSYSGSTSETSQIVVAPSSTTINYEKLACVRVSPGAPGYCLGFSSVSGGNYSNCYVMKNFGYLGTGGCGTVSAKASHTLRLAASGSSPVTLSIYVDGVLKGTVKDSSPTPYTVAGSGFGLEGDGTPADSDVTQWQD